MDSEQATIYLNILYLQMMALMNIQDKASTWNCSFQIIFPLNQFKLYFNISVLFSGWSRMPQHRNKSSQQIANMEKPQDVMEK